MSLHKIAAGSAGGSPAYCVNTVAGCWTSEAGRIPALVGRISAAPSDNTALSDGSRFARLSDLRSAFHAGAGLPAIDAGQRPALPAQEAWV